MDPILKKMNYKGSSPSLVMKAPQGFKAAQAGLVGTVHATPQTNYGFVAVFVKDQAAFKKLVPAVAKKLAEKAVFWVGYPKLASKGLKSDLSRDVLWKKMIPLGFKPARLVAVDQDWAAMRFVRA